MKRVKDIMIDEYIGYATAISNTRFYETVIRYGQYQDEIVALYKKIFNCQYSDFVADVKLRRKEVA